MRTTRALSFGNLEEYEAINEMHFKHASDKPLHRPTQSLLTTTSGFTNFRGLLNWGAFLLILTTSRMALENIIKYGIVIDPASWLLFILRTHDKYFAFGLLLCCNVFILISWLVERATILGTIGGNLTVILSLTNLFGVLAFPTMVICFSDFNPLFSAPVLMVYTVVFLKLWSYFDVNRWCRNAPKSEIPDLLVRKSRDEPSRGSLSDQEDTGSVQDSTTSNIDESTHGLKSAEAEDRHNQFAETVRCRRGRSQLPPNWNANMPHNERSNLPRASIGRVDEYKTMLDAIELDSHGLFPTLNCNEITANRYVIYPNNVTLKDLYYFMFAPTLCYELNFPRTLTIRKPFVLRRLLEILFLSQLMLCFTQQWVIPLLKNSVAPIAESNFSQVVERCLKLAIPNHFIWLLFFYASFHSFLNLVGELMKFGDRFFYSDWWNAESVPAFWSKWNIPVHRFARRHIYVPLIGCGLTRPQSGMVVFFVSALLHEFLISVPLKMPRMWAFLGMFSQMPYTILIGWLFPKGGACGNVAVWITLIIGQPLAMLFYFHDYYLAHYVQ